VRFSLKLGSLPIRIEAQFRELSHCGFQLSVPERTPTPGFASGEAVIKLKKKEMTMLEQLVTPSISFSTIMKR
jgi:hypothetical protein